MTRKILNLLLLLGAFSLSSQTTVFKESVKWGIKSKDKVIIQPVHDTIFNFDSTGKVCLACARTRSPHPNKYIKTPVFSFSCVYLNRDGKRLVIKQGEDTAGIFSLHKYTPGNYMGNGNIMTVEVGNMKNLVDKDFKQITSKGYDEVYFSPDPAFIIAGRKNEGHTLLMGLVNLKEDEIIPLRYSGVKLNTKDSLIIACTAGLGSNSEDDIFNYEGKKLSSSHRHIELATKTYIVHRIFVPKEYLLIVNLKTKEERQEVAEEVRMHTDNEILMMNEGHWFTYDITTHKKKAYKK
jgi:hypothetical protein